jgi:hypothetical protein
MPNKLRDASFLISRQASSRVLRPRAVSGATAYALKTGTEIRLIPVDGADATIDFQRRRMCCIGYCSIKQQQKLLHPTRRYQDRPTKLRCLSRRK